MLTVLRIVNLSKLVVVTIRSAILLAINSLIKLENIDLENTLNASQNENKT